MYDTKSDIQACESLCIYHQPLRLIFFLNGGSLADKRSSLRDDKLLDNTRHARKGAENAGGEEVDGEGQGQAGDGAAFVLIHAGGIPQEC